MTYRLFMSPVACRFHFFQPEVINILRYCISVSKGSSGIESHICVYQCLSSSNQRITPGAGWNVEICTKRWNETCTPKVCTSKHCYDPDNWHWTKCHRAAWLSKIPVKHIHFIEDVWPSLQESSMYCIYVTCEEVVEHWGAKGTKSFDVEYVWYETAWVCFTLLVASVPLQPLSQSELELQPSPAHLTSRPCTSSLCSYRERC